MTLLPINAIAEQDRVEVIDGQRLSVAGAERTLYGIEVPGLGEQCDLRGRKLDCGILARAGLLDLIAGATVRCQPARGEPSAYLCRANGYDLSEGMVHTGWARAKADAPTRLKAVMATAKSRGHGMWYRAAGR